MPETSCTCVIVDSIIYGRRLPMAVLSVPRPDFENLPRWDRLYFDPRYGPTF